MKTVKYVPVRNIVVVSKCYILRRVMKEKPTTLVLNENVENLLDAKHP